MDTPHIEPELLLERDGRLRALARALVRDAGAADDLVQDTWLAWLERGASARSLPAWLATLVRRAATRTRRTDERRARREGIVARAEAEPATHEILEREEARARVVAALAALAEPLRTTLVLRFLEDLPPRAVAARMRVPVETVRTRTRRGLDALRAELDRSFEARERWLAAVLPLTRAARPSLGPTLAAMSIPAKLTVSAAALALLAWLLWPHSSPAAIASSSPVARAEREAALVQASSNELTSAHGTTPDAREAIAQALAAAPEPPATESTGSLDVHVRWLDEPRAPSGDVSGVVVRVVPGALENPDLDAREVVTDENGHARFESLPPGETRVAVDRHMSPPQSVVVAQHETARLEVDIEHGFDIAGLVTDEAERPVAGAEIWFGRTPDLANGTCVAHSASDGSFRLRGISQAHLGARASGYRPSRIHYFFAESLGEVRAQLVLRGGAGAVEGVVLAPSGEPVRDALVRVGPPGPGNDQLGEVEDADWGTRTRSDDAGRFRVAGVSACACPVVVRAAGFALHRGEVEVAAGASASLAVTLAPEPALEGHVHDAFGAPVAGVLVRVGRDDGPFEAAARSDADGAFRVGALEAGVPLEAWVEGGPGSATTEFQAAAGETARWEAVLEGLGEIRGRMLDEHGAALAGWLVYLEDQEHGLLESDQHGTRSAVDGSFSFARVHERLHTLGVTAPHAGFDITLVRTNVRPGPDELVLRLSDAMIPSARVVGSFLDEAGRPVANMQILPYRTGSAGAAYETCDPRTGHFELGPYPPGEMQLAFQVPGRASVVRWHSLHSGETWNVGEVRLAPEGRLRVHLVASELEPDDSLQLSLDSFFERFEGTGAERRSPPLPPRAYTLRVGGGAFAELALPFEIESGAEAVLDVPLRRGWRTSVAVRAPDSAPLGRLLVHTPGGTLEHFLWQREGGVFVETLHLPAGSFEVEASAGELTAVGTLVVMPIDRDEPALVLTLE